MREKIFRVAGRFGLIVHVVSNGSRPIRPPGLPNIRMVIVPEGPNIADDWIAKRITSADIFVTADILLASRCLALGARAVSHTRHFWTPDNIGAALTGREIARHMRASGIVTKRPAPLDKAARSSSLSALDSLIQTAIRARRSKTMLRDHI